MDNTKPELEPFNYLGVNRGRFLCVEHGAFCDSSDNYLSKCPLCPEARKDKPWQINKVDRLLHVVNGLQNRSKRNVALLASLIGGIGVLRLVSEFGGNSTHYTASGFAQLCAYLAVVVFLISLAMYGASMAHIQTTEGHAMKKKSLSGWEQYLAGKLSEMECWHKWAGRLFGTGAVLLAVAVLVQMIFADDVRSILQSWFVCENG